MASLEQQYDLIIVGSGGGGLCAALVAQAQGRRPVVLEKLPKVGGSTAYSGGVWWVPNNPLMAREGIEDSYEKSRRYFDAVVPDEGPATSPARREAFLRSGPRMIEFLEQQGMALFRPDGWSDYYDERPGGSPRSRSLMAQAFDVHSLGAWSDRLALYPPFRKLPFPVHAHEGVQLMLLWRTWKAKALVGRLLLRGLSAKLTGKRLVTNGAAIQGRMLKLVLDAGIPVFPETAVRDLVVEGGRVVGVIAERSGATTTVRARDAVLIASGGFARNSAMLAQHQRQPASATNATPGETGELIEAATRHGAATAAMDSAWWLFTSRGTDGRWPKGAVDDDGAVYPFMHNLDIALPFSIIVDQDGRRFVNECSSYVEQGERMYQRQQETGRAIPAWLVMDSRNRRWYGLGLEAPGSLPKEWIESGYMKKADTLDDLARVCGIDAHGLRQTVDRFNGFCRSGLDEDFQRGARQYDRWRGDPTVEPNPNLGPIERAPFYAVALYPTNVGTAGGMLTDEHARVLRPDGTTIPGLYATGNCTASVMGHTYPAAGASIAASFVFGFIAAHHSAAGPSGTTRGAST